MIMDKEVINNFNKEIDRVMNNNIKSISSTYTVPVRLSFQMMTRAEPVEMVIASIKSLIAIKAEADEILIIDNNHTDTALYMPIKRFCAGLDDSLNVRFFHVDSVAGFKAGALNLALDIMDDSCSHIVVVDSDYQALPQARASIVAAIERYPDCALLQFPQFYRDAGQADVHSELNHYFNYHLHRLFNRKRALSTGTYAIIRRDALLSLGGWSGASITEDAQMGVLMHKRGLRSQFIPEVIATGLLPNSVNDLMSQRRRWIYGNMQVLTRYFAQHLPSLSVDLPPKISFKERLAYWRAHFSQLSAWINFTGIFIICHVFTVGMMIGALLLKLNLNLSFLLQPLYVVYASYALFLVRRLWAYLHDDAPLNQQVDIDSADSAINNKRAISKKLRAWLLHLNFWELGALSWLPVLWGRSKPFICTPKQMLIRTRRTLNMSNLLALPKLLLFINALTALLVAPFSPFYAPVLLICALSICLLKLLAARVMFANYKYVEPHTETFVKPYVELKSAAVVNKVRLKQSSINEYEDQNVINS